LEKQKETAADIRLLIAGEVRKSVKIVKKRLEAEVLADKLSHENKNSIAKSDTKENTKKLVSIEKKMKEELQKKKREQKKFERLRKQLMVEFGSQKLASHP
jgi:hypothetical protein